MPSAALFCCPAGGYERSGGERSFAWAARFRRLARDYERLPETLAGLHFVAFAMRLAARFVQLAHFLNPQGCGCS